MLFQTRVLPLQNPFTVLPARGGRRVLPVLAPQACVPGLRGGVPGRHYPLPRLPWARRRGRTEGWQSVCDVHFFIHGILVIMYFIYFPPFWGGLYSEEEEYTVSKPKFDAKFGRFMDDVSNQIISL